MTLGLAYTLISIFFIFAIGTVVYLHNHRSVTHQMFALMALSTIFWSLANYYSVLHPEEVMSIRMVLFFALPHIFVFFLFVYNFPQDRLRMPTWLLVPGVLVFLGVMGLTLSDYIFSSVAIRAGVPHPVPGALMPVFALLVLSTLFASLFLMARKYVQAKNEERTRWFFMIVGTLLSYVLLIFTNFILVVFFNNTNFIVFGPLFMLPTFAGMTVAVLRYRLFDIKVVGAELLTFAVVFISLTDVLLAETITTLTIRLVMFVLFSLFGVLLIRGVIREVEHREQIEKLADNLADANNRLRELDRQKSEFLSIAAHQLRTPLAAIKGYASMMIEGSYGELRNPMLGIMETIFASTSRMVDTVGDFLNVSRIEQGVMDYRKVSADLATISQEVVKELALSARDKGLDLEYHEGSSAHCPIFVDVSKIKHVVANLVDNAIKYTLKGRVTVRVECDTENGIGRVKVSDTGTGIPADALPTLFDKFVRARNAQDINVTGTGLGLYVAREMVRAHGGTVQAASEGEGKGSTFTIEIPLLKEGEHPEEVEEVKAI